MITEQNIKDALSVIIDPDFNKDIVSLGFVKNIKINEGEVSFDIELTTPACPIKSEFQRQAEEAVRSLKGVTSVTVNMTAQKRPQPGTSPQIKSTLEKVTSIIAVSSCKGGVGKSTVAACLAKELAQRGHKVGLVDTDIYGPSIPALLNITNAKIQANEQQQLLPIIIDGLKVMSFGFLLGDGPAVMRGPIVSRYIQQLLHMTDWGELDYLFIDMPPGTGDIQLTITQNVQLNGAVIVTTRQTLSLVDVQRGILMFEKVDVPILGIIENMSYFLCTKCDEKHYIFGGNKNQTLTERFGLEILGELPLLPELTKRLDRRLENPVIKETVDKTIMALGKNSIRKKTIPDIKFNTERIYLKWDDGEELSVANRDLRLSCRCALCVDELSGKQLLNPADIKENIAAKDVLPLGNYALSIIWNDGHSSGIYPYKTIRTLPQYQSPARESA